MHGNSVTLPKSGVQVEVTDEFTKEKVSSFLSSLLQDELSMQSYRKEPEKTLSEIGIKIKKEDIGKISPDDLHTIREPNVGPQAWAAVAVAVAVFCYPSKVGDDVIKNS